MGRKSKFDSSFKSKIAIEAVKEQRVKLVDKRPD